MVLNVQCLNVVTGKKQTGIKISTFVAKLSS